MVMSFNIRIPEMIMKASMIKIMMPGLMPVDFEMRSPNKSAPPGLIRSRSMRPTPIPIMVPPRMACAITGRCNKPFNGARKSIIVDVKASPITALMK